MTLRGLLLIGIYMLKSPLPVWEVTAERRKRKWAAEVEIPTSRVGSDYGPTSCPSLRRPLKSPLPVWEVTARYCGRSLGLPAFSRHQPRIETATGAQGSVRTRNFGAKLPQISVYSGFALVLYHILAVKSTVFSIRCVLLFVVFYFCVSCPCPISRKSSGMALPTSCSGSVFLEPPLQVSFTLPITAARRQSHL